jgi:hypothetical protein
MKQLRLLFFAFIVCQKLCAQGGEIISKGVLFFNVNKTYTLPETFKVMNNDKSVYLTFKKINNDSTAIKKTYSNSIQNNLIRLKQIFPFYFNNNNKNNVPLPDVFTRAYYPDSGVIIIDANKINKKYFEIFIDGEWKYIEDTNFKYQKWNTFLKQTYIQLYEKDKIYSKKSIASKQLIFPNDLNFRIIKVSGDWIKIECNTVCEECNHKITGWVKWKDGNQILINILYVC